MYPRARRFLILAVAVLVMSPVMLVFINAAKTPTLYAGDKIEKRTCRDCGGSGDNEGLDGTPIPFLEVCPACGGDGKVDVIIPGAARPTRIRGAVADKEGLVPFATYGDVRPGGRRSIEKPRATIGGITVRFERKDGKVHQVETNPYGLFNTQLPPGHYTVKVAAPGFEAFEEELEIPRLTEEIWIDDAVIIREPRSQADAQSRYGFELLIAISARDSGDAQLVISFGTR